ncbi:MAG: carboxylate--amine ligase [Betaproteobacteria bacterium]
MEPRQAVVCAGDAGINALATVRSLGRRGVPVQVFALKASPQIASRSRYCRGATLVDGPDDLCTALLDFGRRRQRKPVLYVDNDPMLKLLAPHAGVLAARFELVDPVGDAVRLTDKQFQVSLARRCGIAVPRTWFPTNWAGLAAIRSARRLIAKPTARAGFKTLMAGSPGELAAELRARGAAPSEVLVQEYIEGDDAQIYAGLAYRARSIDRCFVMSGRKLRQSEPGAGVMAVGQAVDAPQVREMTRRLARAAGMHGVLCSEFKLDPADGRYYFIEWNPRPAYFQSLGWKAGFDLAWLAWCDHAEPLRLEHPPMVEATGHYWVNLHCDLAHLARAPGIARRFATWRPYLGRTEWAVFAADDPRPWLAATRNLGAWIRDAVARRAAAARAAPQAAAAAAGRSPAQRRPAPR